MPPTAASISECALCHMAYEKAVGVGCERCVGRLHRDGTLAPGFARSKVPHDEARASLVDPFGTPLPIGHRALIGRPESGAELQVEIPILTVSRTQGHIAYTGRGEWTIENLGQVGGLALTPHGAFEARMLAAREIVPLGPVDVLTLGGRLPLMFWPEPLRSNQDAPGGSLPTKKREMKYRLDARRSLVVHAQAADGLCTATVERSGHAPVRMSAGRWVLLHRFISTRTNGDLSAHAVRSLVGLAGPTEAAVRRRMTDLRNFFRDLEAPGVVCEESYRLHPDCNVTRLER